MSDTPIDRKAMLKQAHETVAKHAMEGRPAPGVTLDGTSLQNAHYERWTQVTLTLAYLGDTIDEAERWAKQRARQACGVGDTASGRVAAAKEVLALLNPTATPEGKRCDAEVEREFCEQRATWSVLVHRPTGASVVHYCDEHVGRACDPACVGGAAEAPVAIEPKEER